MKNVLRTCNGTGQAQLIIIHKPQKIWFPIQNVQVHINSTFLHNSCNHADALTLIHAFLYLQPTQTCHQYSTADSSNPLSQSSAWAMVIRQWDSRVWALNQELQTLKLTQITQIQTLIKGGLWFCTLGIFWDYALAISWITFFFLTSPHYYTYL